VKIIEGEVVHVGSAAPRAGRPVSGLAVLSVVLLVATVVLGTLLVRERSAHEDDQRHLRAQAARSMQRAAALGAELAVVRAQREEAEERLAWAVNKGWSPEAVAALRACVRYYAELERTAGGAVPPGASTCVNAEPYVR
jgi:hypothetical protein